MNIDLDKRYLWDECHSSMTKRWLFFLSHHGGNVCHFNNLAPYFQKEKMDLIS